MTDLKHWNFADDFSAEEAAVLIFGNDPTHFMADAMCRPIIEKLLSSYHESWGYWHTRSDGIFQFNENVTLPNTAIQSIGMLRHQEIITKHEISENFAKHGIPEGFAEYFDRWIGHGTSQDGEFSAFKLQRFSRGEITRWLSAIGMKSVYQFNFDQPVKITATSARWPWGKHHTELLGHLSAAAERYWVNYDKADTTTCPTNAVVSDWLQTERKVSQTMADSIASILRLDRLPTGPRK